MAFKKRIVLIEECQKKQSLNEIVLSGLEDLIIVNSYSNFIDAISNIEIDKPDLVITEIVFENGLNGIEGIRMIKSNNPLIQVIVHTTVVERNVVLDSFRAGAMGYITKETSYLDFYKLIKQIFEGGVAISPIISRIIVENFHSDPISPLTQREKMY